MDNKFLVFLLLLLKRSCNTLLYVLKNVSQYSIDYEIWVKLLNLKNFSFNILNIAVFLLTLLILRGDSAKAALLILNLGDNMTTLSTILNLGDNMTTLSTIIINHQNISKNHLVGKELHCKGKLYSRVELCSSQIFLIFYFS